MMGLFITWSYLEAVQAQKEGILKIIMGIR